MCSNYQSELIAGARAQLKLKLRSDEKFEEKFTSEACTFAPFFCKDLCPAGSNWLPWGGCSTPFPNLIYDPIVWPACNKGYIHNSKGICIPKPFYFKNTLIPVPCSIFRNEHSEVAVSVEHSTPTPNLINNLNDKKVRLEAAKQVLEDLQATINSVNKEIETLSN